MASLKTKKKVNPGLIYSWWPDGKPARWYAGVISRLRPDLRAEAMSRVPEIIRGLVKTHLSIFEQRGRNA